MYRKRYMTHSNLVNGNLVTRLIGVAYILFQRVNYTFNIRRENSGSSKCVLVVCNFASQKMETR